MTVDRQTVEAARSDVGIFAEALVGEELWAHQLDVARSAARIRCICSGRQAGKTRTLAVCALHDAFRGPDRRVLVVSAGEAAARDLLSEVTALAQAPLLAGSVLDDNASQLTLSNGSTIRSVPASTRQVRGKSVDLLIVDEAAFVDEELWQAARYTVLARPGSRVLMASTPWGRRDRFFAVAYRAGLAAAKGYAAFHWPATVSPLVDRELLELWRTTSTAREYAAEVEAEWVDETGAYFTSAELDVAVADYDFVPPSAARGRAAVAGVDWGFAADANTVVLLARSGRGDPGGDSDAKAYWLPWLEEHFGLAYDAFIARLATIGAGYRLRRVASETNGVGQFPTQELKRRLGAPVNGVHTDNRSKEDGFGAMKMLIAQGRLVLPRHPALLRQLAALEFSTRESGRTHIAVPERAGHDDLAMALCLAVSAEPDATSRQAGPHRRSGPAIIRARIDGGLPSRGTSPGRQIAHARIPRSGERGSNTWPFA